MRHGVAALPGEPSRSAEYGPPFPSCWEARSRSPARERSGLSLDCSGRIIG